jgi:hypothetical protein
MKVIAYNTIDIVQHVAVALGTDDIEVLDQLTEIVAGWCMEQSEKDTVLLLIENAYSIVDRCLECEDQ